MMAPGSFPRQPAHDLKSSNRPVSGKKNRANERKEKGADK